jgi:CheY-like chemotaxis protein
MAKPAEFMAPSAGPRRPTILAIDDDPGVLDGIRLLLGERYTVVTASTGPAGLDVFGRHRVDLVLLDLRLPGMYGLEVLQRIRACQAGAIVIVVSAVMDVREVVRSMKLGAWDYVTKPWDDDEFTGAVARACREAEAGEGVLLVSEDWAALAPLHLALERRCRVTTAGMLGAIQSAFPARVVVVDASGTGRSRTGILAELYHRFPRAAWIVLVDDAATTGGPRPASPRADAIAVRPCQVDHLVHRVEALLGACDSGDAASPPLPRPVARAIELMTRTYGQRLTVDDYARAVGLSYDRFAHVFRAAVGVPVKEYLIRLRIAVARRLLRETDHKLDEVARMTGFADASNFSRAFTSQAGVRPGHFRAELRAGAD